MIEPVQQHAFFNYDQVTQHWTVKPEVRALVTWKQHNLLSPLKEEPFDCIFLKNVLIYFDTESKQAVVKNVIHSLAKGGYLVIGPTEGIYAMLDPLCKINPGCTNGVPHRGGKKPAFELTGRVRKARLKPGRFWRW